MSRHPLRRALRAHSYRAVWTATVAVDRWGHLTPVAVGAGAIVAWIRLQR